MSALAGMLVAAPFLLVIAGVDYTIAGLVLVIGWPVGGFLLMAAGEK